MAKAPTVARHPPRRPHWREELPAHVPGFVLKTKSAEEPVYLLGACQSARIELPPDSALKFDFDLKHGNCLVNIIGAALREERPCQTSRSCVLHMAGRIRILRQRCQIV